MTTQTETRPEAAQTHESSGEGLASFGLAHIAACCGAGAAAVLVVILIERLT